MIDKLCLNGDYHEFVGLSGDDKPTDVAVCSTFHELDTDDKYYFDGETWAKIGSETGGEG